MTLPNGRRLEKFVNCVRYRSFTTDDIRFPKSSLFSITGRNDIRLVF